MDKKPRTHASTRAGLYPAPTPLYSPLTLAFGTIEAGDIDIPPIDLSMGSVAISAARPAPASVEGSVTSVSRPPSASRAGDISSDLPTLTRSEEDAGLHRDVQGPGKDDGGWTPVTRKTSRNHRERRSNNGSNHTSSYASDSAVSDSESESTYAQATHEMTRDDLEALVRRHEAITAQYHAQLARKAESETGQKSVKVDNSGNIPNVRKSIFDSELAPAFKARSATVEEVEDEGDLISFSPMPGSSQNKGKGPDPRNWGNISSLHNFSEEELKQQREMLQNYEEINHIIKREDHTVPTGDLVDFFPEQASTPDLKKSRKCLKSPRPKKTKARAKVPRRVEVLVPPAAEAPLRQTVSVESLMKVPKNSGVFFTASGSDPHPDRAPQSGLSVQSVQEMLSAINKRIDKLAPRQRAENRPSEARTETQPEGKSSKPGIGKTPLPWNLTPGGVAAEAFFEKALRGTPATSARARCFQGSKEVAAHVAEWSQIWNSIGVLEDTQEKIVKLFNSFTSAVQIEIYHKDFDPEKATWDEIVRAAKQAEVLLKLAKGPDNGGNGSKPLQQQQQQRSNNSRSQNANRSPRGGRWCGRGGRANQSRPREEVMRTSAVGVPSKGEGELSPQRRNEMLAKGLCFNCSEPGHLSRNCPKKQNVPSKKKGKPPGFSAYAVYIPTASSSCDVLHESTTVLESMHVGAIRFGDLGRVEEGGEPLETFVEFSEPSSDFELISNVSGTDSDAPSEPVVDSDKSMSDIWDLYTFYTALALQAAQPYPEDVNPCGEDENFKEKHFLLYLVSDNQYVVMDSACDEESHLEVKLLHDPDFKPALWYAQTRMKSLGMNPDSASREEHFQAEMGDIQVEVVELLLKRHEWDESKYGPLPADRFEQRIEELNEVQTSSDSGSSWVAVPNELNVESASAASASTQASMPPLKAVSDTESELGSDNSSLLGLRTDSGDESNDNSDSDSDSNDGSGMPSLEPMSGLSDSGSEDDESTHLVMPGDDGETFEDRLKLWAEASKEAMYLGTPSWHCLNSSSPSPVTNKSPGRMSVGLC
ncbi:hypothetical protein B0H19DRAFT_1296911 [Mycena capillaripes]|nr:hypothetical protein B0H19DRAFT_1296911 [Mycena capillaripes]